MKFGASLRKSWKQPSWNAIRSSSVSFFGGGGGGSSSFLASSSGFGVSSVPSPSPGGGVSSVTGGVLVSWLPPQAANSAATINPLIIRMVGFLSSVGGFLARILHPSGRGVRFKDR